MAAEGKKAAVSANRCGELGRDQHLAAERLAQSLNAGDLINCWADHSKIKPVDGADVAVLHLAEMQRKIDRDR